MEKKIIFFGLGSIGTKHASIIQKNYGYELFAFRTNKGQEKNNLNIKEFYNLKDAFAIKPDIAFITNPTCLHIKTAFECATKNINLFIEKPIDCALNGINELYSEIKKRKIFSYVAYNLRFHPVIEELKKIINKQEKPIYFRVVCSSYLPDWRSNQDYTKSYSAKSKMGGGVILDLSHEFDYISWLFGEIEQIKGFSGKISNLKIDSEDIADLTISCKSKIKGSLHLDYFSKNNQRKISIYFNDRYIEGDLISNRIKIINKNNKEKKKKFSFIIDETYTKQLEYFFKNFNHKNLDIMNNFSEALKTFKKIMEFKSNYC